MALANHHQHEESNNASSLPTDLPDAPSSHIQEYHHDQESPSDNETSEKPLREKLKKASLASIPKQMTPGLRARDQEGMVGVIQTEDEVKDISENKDNTNEFTEPRGRQMGKRSHEDVEGLEVSYNAAPSNESSKHRRKESRDMHLGSVVMEEHSRTRSSEATAAEQEDAVGLGRNSSQPGEGRVDVLTDSAWGHDVGRNGEDTTFSPRKKRSREQVDTEVDRELKIAATDGARARRSSEERDQAYKSATVQRESLDKTAQIKVLIESGADSNAFSTDVKRSKVSFTVAPLQVSLQLILHISLLSVSTILQLSRHSHHRL